MTKLVVINNLASRDLAQATIPFPINNWENIRRFII